MKNYELIKQINKTVRDLYDIESLIDPKYRKLVRDTQIRGCKLSSILNQEYWLDADKLNEVAVMSFASEVADVMTLLQIIYKQI